MKNYLAGSLVALVVLLGAWSAGATSYTLTVVAQGSGSITTNPVFATYPANATVALTATPNTGWYFAGWTGAVTASTNPVNVTITGNLSETGLFLAYPTYRLTLATNGSGGIALSPGGGSYNSNTVVTATATAATGWVFTDWTGVTNSTVNPLALAVDGNGTLTANFAEPPVFDVVPQSVTNVAGSTVSFTAHAAGTPPVTYQWYDPGFVPLTGATNGTLTLSNITASEGGSYTVTATNNYGYAFAGVNLVLTNGNESTNVVTVCDEAGLRAAIANGGWISFGCSGTITLSQSISITGNVILDGGQSVTTISGSNAVQLFYVAPGASLAITNLTLANGAVPNGVAGGGAIENNGGTVSLTDVTLTNNTVVVNRSQAAAGGAIYNVNGKVTIVGSVLEDNENAAPTDSVAAVYGGAIFQASGALFMTNCLVISNEVVGAVASFSNYGGHAGPAYGGGLGVVGGSVAMDGCQWVANTAQGGTINYHAYAGPAFAGGLYSAATVAAVRCAFWGNQAVCGSSYNFAVDTNGATACGGAIYNDNGGTMVLRNSLMCSNITQGGGEVADMFTMANGGNGIGGAIFNAATLMSTNCTIALNTSFSGQGRGEYGTTIYMGNAFGGGVFNSTNASFAGLNVTIASNICDAVTVPYGGIAVGGFGAGANIANTNGTLALRNSLVAYGGTNGNAYGAITDLGDNISSDGTTVFASGTSFNNTDPQLAGLANNGGPTLTMALEPGSPAIAYANSATAPPDDQRGYARPVGDGVIDLGAYQSGATQIYNPFSISLSIAKAFPNVLVSFTTSPDITNTLHFQSSTNLFNWTDVQTFEAFTSPSNISETISTKGVAQEFFRVTW